MTRTAIILLALVAACDKDPTRPTPDLRVTCPTGVQDVNTPLTFTFGSPIAPTSVSSSSVAVSEASTGVEIPGTSVLVTSDAKSIRFTPSSAFRFGDTVRVRLQNLLTSPDLQPFPITVCNIVTAPPPITEVFWNRLTSAGGSTLLGGSLLAPGTGVLINQFGTVFKRAGSGDFFITYTNPYYNAGADLTFVTNSRGFAAFGNARTRQRILGETNDAGVTFSDTVLIPISPTRLFFRATAGTSPNNVFGVIGGGSPGVAQFAKYDPATATVTTTGTFNSTAAVSDIDFGADTTNGAAVSSGVKVGVFDARGQVYTTTDGGRTWNIISSLQATSAVQFYDGVAVRKNGDVFVVGGGGYAARVQDVNGTATVTQLLTNAVTSIDSTNPSALVYTDVAFAPDNDQVGWIVGARLTGIVNGVPQFQGLIFITRDGGATWTRQGVRGAPDYGAQFPQLNRIIPRTQADAWLIGEAGTVLQYQP